MLDVVGRLEPSPGYGRTWLDDLDRVEGDSSRSPFRQHVLATKQNRLSRQNDENLAQSATEASREECVNDGGENVGLNLPSTPTNETECESLFPGLTAADLRCCKEDSAWWEPYFVKKHTHWQKSWHLRSRDVKVQVN